MKALLLAVSSVVALLVASPASGCGTAKTERLPTDAGQIVYECRGCCKVLQPKPGDWRVFCSYGSMPARRSRRSKGNGARARQLRPFNEPSFGQASDVASLRGAESADVFWRSTKSAIRIHLSAIWCHAGSFSGLGHSLAIASHSAANLRNRVDVSIREPFSVVGDSDGGIIRAVKGSGRK
jgi:hypothetical protein